MALITPFFLNTVVALGERTEDGSVKYNATGFLYGYLTGATNEQAQELYRIFLITNRHVFHRALQRSDILHARFNRPKDVGANIYEVELKHASWTVHPDPKVDVAVMNINHTRLNADGIEYSFFESNRHVFTLEQARAQEIGEGDGVFVLGFPLGNAGDERNYAIVRQGVIARAQDWLNGKSNTFLIDASIFPGNSGGPVLIKPEGTSVHGTQANTRNGLVGMVSEYLTYQEIAVSTQTERPRMIFEENSGLGVVVPHDAILETVKIAFEKSTRDSNGENEASA